MVYNNRDNFQINYQRYDGLPVKDIFKIIEVLISNKNFIGCGNTHICFAAFREIYLKKIERGEVHDLNYNHLKMLMEYIKMFQQRFSRDIFLELLHDKLTDEMPLDLLWWLDTNNIDYFEQHCVHKPVNEILESLFKLLKTPSSENENELHHPKNMASYFLLKIITVVYCPSPNDGNFPMYVNWTNTCSQILVQLINPELETLLHHHAESNFIIFINALDKQKYLNKNIMKRFFVYNLNKLFTCPNAENLYETIRSQNSWSTKTIPEDIIIFFHQMIKRFDLNEFFDLINKIPENDINWKFTLIAVSVYLTKIPNQQNQFRQFINKSIHTVFNEKHDIFQLQKLILIQRQACLETEQPTKSYSDWYANTFGMNSNLKSSTDKKSFTFLIETLTKLIEYEPEYVLKTHIDRSLRFPANCQNDMLIFKDLCRIQLAKIQQTPQTETMEIINL